MVSVDANLGNACNNGQYVHTYNKAYSGAKWFVAQASFDGTFQSLTEQALYTLTSVVKGQHDF